MTKKIPSFVNFVNIVENAIKSIKEGLCPACSNTECSCEDNAVTEAVSANDVNSIRSEIERIESKVKSMGIDKDGKIVAGLRNALFHIELVLGK